MAVRMIPTNHQSNLLTVFIRQILFKRDQTQILFSIIVIEVLNNLFG
jgi:hypothetical protein